jgi:hypothetical protein
MITEVEEKICILKIRPTLRMHTPVPGPQLNWDREQA